MSIRFVIHSCSKSVIVSMHEFQLAANAQGTWVDGFDTPGHSI